MDTKTASKLRHIEACLMDESQYRRSAGFEQLEFTHQAASNKSLDAIDLNINFLGHRLRAPLMIAPMTGGIQLGEVLNTRWAKAAQYFGIAFGVGSQRLALDDKNARKSFQVRQYAPDALIFANLGIAQLLKHEGAARALQAVDMIAADALFIHVNPLQEVCQERGDTDFTHMQKAIESIVLGLSKIGVPVLVREVGFGLSVDAAMRFLSTGVAGIDCSGAGGTSWSKVEAMCATSDTYRRLGKIFGEWGIPTADSIRNVRAVDTGIPLIASGGIRSGLDAAKAIALGANLVAMARPMLQAAVESEEKLFLFIEQIIRELRVAMFATDAASIDKLSALSLKKFSL